MFSFCRLNARSFYAHNNSNKPDDISLFTNKFEFDMIAISETCLDHRHPQIGGKNRHFPPWNFGMKDQKFLENLNSAA